MDRRAIWALVGLLVISALAVLGVVAWRQVQAFLDRTSPPRLAARAIHTQLRDHADTVGPVEISAAELRLLEGRLRLAVSKPPDADDDDPTGGHLHVLATAAEAPTAALDACLLGPGNSLEERIENVADSFVTTAFPPVLSHSRGEPVLGSLIFWGDEPWAVPGMHGYAGAVRSRGSIDPADFSDAPLFSDVPIPRDGKLHLIKTVLFPKDGFWVRTVELDGQGTGISERRFAPLEPDAQPGMIVRYAVFGKEATPAAADGRDRAFQRLKAREPWLFTAGDCPADLIPAAFPEFSFSSSGCVRGRLLDCLRECERGAASFCYTAAQEVLSSNLDAPAAQALFLRSCRLGYASGCTNAAAGRLADGAIDTCSFRTFEHVCERTRDPWACAMLGAALWRGDVAPPDPVRARTVLAKACERHEKDPACQAAKTILSRLEPPSPVR